VPYTIKKLPSGQYAKVRKDTGKIVSRHASRDKAVGSIFAEISHTGEKASDAAPGVDLSRRSKPQRGPQM
jgi:hypothetical protein